MGSRFTLAVCAALLVVGGFAATDARAEDLGAARTAQAVDSSTILTAIPVSSFDSPAMAECGTCGCQPDACNPCCKRLRFSLSLVGWITALDGTIGSGASDIDVDVSVGDVLENLDKVDSLLQGNIRADYGKWWARFSGSYIALGGGGDFTVDPGSVRVDAEITQAYYQLVAGYNVKTSAGPRVGCCCSSIRYDVFAGARWADMEVKVTTPGVALGGARDWVDPVVGGVVTWDLKNRWVLDLDADIGGFGVNSDLTWRLRLGATWNPTRWLGIGFGYLALDYDYTTGSGTDRFAWDVLTHGPYLGLNFRF